MNRLLVALLAALDAVIAVAVGLVAVAAPLTLLWVFGFPGVEDWAALWPTSVRLWQFGHFVPVEITLPAEYLTATGIPEEAASFVLSLAPTALAAFTAIFAARSGARAAKAGAWPYGVVAGAIAVAALATAVALTATLELAVVDVLPAIGFPTLVYLLPALGGALVGAWRYGDDGVVDAVRAAAARDPRWADVPAAAARGLGAVVAGVLGLGALAVAAAVLFSGGDIVGLYQAANLDLIGVVVVSLGQLAYLPTLVVWGASFVAGPGFAVGAGTTVSPAGTSLGVVPGLPIFGALPEATSTWMLLLALGVVGVGVLAGWTARNRLAVADSDADPFAERLVTLAGIVFGSGAAAAALAVLASGAMGPGRLATTGPAPGPFALTVAVEVAVGAGIMLLAPRLEQAPAPGGSAGTSGGVGWEQPRSGATGVAGRSGAGVAGAGAAGSAWHTWSTDDTQPIEPLDTDALGAAAAASDRGATATDTDTDTATDTDADTEAATATATDTEAAGPAPATPAGAVDMTETIPLDEHLPPRHEAEGDARPPVD